MWDIEKGKSKKEFLNVFPAVVRERGFVCARTRVCIQEVIVL